MKTSRLQDGVTLVELLIVLVIMALLAALVLPVYEEYVSTTRFGVIRMNLDTLRIALEDYRLDNGDYGTSGTTYTGLDGATGLRTMFGWDPSGRDADYANYSVRSYTIGASTLTYDLWGVDDTGYWLRCNDRMGTCCNGKSGGASCP